MKKLFIIVPILLTIFLISCTKQTTETNTSTQIVSIKDIYENNGTRYVKFDQEGENNCAPFPLEREENLVTLETSTPDIKFDQKNISELKSGENYGVTSYIHIKNGKITKIEEDNCGY